MTLAKIKDSLEKKQPFDAAENNFGNESVKNRMMIITVRTSQQEK